MANEPVGCWLAFASLFANGKACPPSIFLEISLPVCAPNVAVCGSCYLALVEDEFLPARGHHQGTISSLTSGSRSSFTCTCLGKITLQNSTKSKGAANGRLLHIAVTDTNCHGPTTNTFSWVEISPGKKVLSPSDISASVKRMTDRVWVPAASLPRGTSQCTI